MAKIRQLFILFAILLAASCDPCDRLGSAVCDCAETPAEQEACKKELELRKSNPSYQKANDPELCRKALSTCLCTGLRRNEVEKCGMTRER